MENLLTNNLISHYALPDPIITNWFIKTQSIYFEIEDTNVGDIILHTTRGLGIAKFSNVDILNVTIINYEKFIKGIPCVTFTNSRRRCDILLYSKDNRYFVLGEIKNRSIIDRSSRQKVKRKAKEQLLSSLQTILAVPAIMTYLTQKATKHCCYFNKQSASPAIINAPNAFNRLSNSYPNGFKMINTNIEQLGFEYYEYTGNQTMNLTK